MPARIRNKQQVEQDRATEVELWLKGWTLRAIATQVGISEGQVRYDLRQVEQEWRAKAVYDFDLIRQRELRRIDLLEAEAWAAWEKSKGPREITTTRQSKKVLAPVEMTSTTTAASKRNEQRDPDARYMAVIQWCISERAKLLGLYAPTEMHLSAGAGKTVSEFVYELPPEGPVDGLTIVGQPQLGPGASNGHNVDNEADVEYVEFDSEEPEIVVDPEILELNGSDTPIDT